MDKYLNYNTIINTYISDLHNNPKSIELTNIKDNEIVVEKLLRLIVGTSRTTRLGPRPSKSTLSKIRSNIKTKIKCNQPLETCMCFGSKKTWDKCSPGVDTAEIFTLLHLKSFSENIKKVYPPGISIRIYIGDAWYDYIYKDRSGIQEYFSGLNSIINYFGINNIKLTSMFKFHENDSSLFQICEDNFHILKYYWYESEKEKEEEWTNLQSYQELIKVGWIGPIPQQTRTHYVKKLERYIPNGTTANRIDAVINYFAYGLMLKQKNLINRNDIESCTFEISLMSPPPGMPKKLRTNRIYLKSLPPQISTRGAPCWAVMGILEEKDKGKFLPSTLSPRDYNNKNYKKTDMIEYKLDSLSIPVSVYRRMGC